MKQNQGPRWAGPAGHAGKGLGQNLRGSRVIGRRPVREVENRNADVASFFDLRGKISLVIFYPQRKFTGGENPPGNFDPKSNNTSEILPGGWIIAVKFYRTVRIL